LQPHDSGKLQFSGNYAHPVPRGLRMKDQLQIYRPRAYIGLSFVMQIEDASCSSPNCNTEVRISTCRFVILYDTLYQGDLDPQLFVLPSFEFRIVNFIGE
jgi:hypothetical protein